MRSTAANESKIIQKLNQIVRIYGAMDQTSWQFKCWTKVIPRIPAVFLVCRSKPTKWNKMGPKRATKGNTSSKHYLSLNILWPRHVYWVITMTTNCRKWALIGFNFEFSNGYSKLNVPRMSLGPTEWRTTYSKVFNGKKSQFRHLIWPLSISTSHRTVDPWVLSFCTASADSETIRSGLGSVVKKAGTSIINFSQGNFIKALVSLSTNVNVATMRHANFPNKFLHSNLRPLLPWLPID